MNLKLLYMDKNIKAGVMTLLAWNVLIIILVVLAAPYKGGSYWFLFNDGTGGIGMSLLLILWSIIWFAIGYHVRKEYYLELEKFRKSYPDISNGILLKEYNIHYAMNATKLLMKLLICAVPWYVIGRYAESSFSTKDYIIVFSLMLLSVIMYRICKQNTL